MTSPVLPPPADDLNALGVFDNLTRGASLGAAFDIGGAQLEAVYTMALGQYQQGRYADAIKLFSFITFHDPVNMKAFKGLGSSLQMVGCHREALVYLGLAMVDDDSDLQTAVQIAESLLHVGQRDDARALLRRLRHEIERHGANDYTRQRVDGLLALLSAPSALQTPQDAAAEAQPEPLH